MALLLLLVRTWPAHVRMNLCFVSHPHSRPCLSTQSLGRYPLPAKHAVLTAPSDAEGCYKDANVNGNMCGLASQATCTGSHDLGESQCCSAAGWCGSTDGHCGDEMLVEYSHSKGLCESDLLRNAEQADEESFDANTTRRVWMQQVANAWVTGVTPHMTSVSGHMVGSKTDAQTLCVPAVIVAAGFTYDLDEECPQKFSLKKETPKTDGHGFNIGLWAVSSHHALWLQPCSCKFDAVPVPVALHSWARVTTILSPACRPLLRTVPLTRAAPMTNATKWARSAGTSSPPTARTRPTSSAGGGAAPCWLPQDAANCSPRPLASVLKMTCRW